MNYLILDCLRVPILLIVIPIIVFGIKDTEVYRVGFFSNTIYNYNFFNPFIFFIDFYGPGINFPIGNFPYLHPFSILLSENIRWFFFLSGLFNLFIQINYFNKILKFFKIKKENRFFSFFIIFAISNFNYLWSDDWISVFYTYTFFFPCFYYYLKVIRRGDLLSFLQFSFIFGFTFINSHPGLLVNFCLFLLLVFIFNYHLYLLKNKFFYLLCFLFFLIVSENIIFLLTEYFKFDQNMSRHIQPGYSFKHYIASILLPANFGTYFEINRYPTFGLIFYIGVLKSLQTIFKKKSKNILYLDFILIILIILTLTDLPKKLIILSGVWQLRDLINILSFILFFIFLKDLKNIKLKKIILFSHILFIIIFYVGNFMNYIPYKYENINIISQKDMSSNSFFALKDIYNENLFENRTYLSPKIYEDMQNMKFSSQGVFATTDLIKFNLSPFHGDFKNISLDKIQKSVKKMRGYLIPNYKEMNSEYFLSIFKIKYFIIYKDEISKIKDLNKFDIVKASSNINGNKILFLKRKNYKSNIVIDKNSLDKISCNNKNLIECININKKIFKKIDYINFTKTGVNEYFIENLSKNTAFLVVPFLYDDYWTVSNNNILNFDKRLMVVKVDNKLTLSYKNNLRFFLKSLSILTILVLLCTIIYYKNKIR